MAEPGQALEGSLHYALYNLFTPSTLRMMKKPTEWLLQIWKVLKKWEGGGGYVAY